MSKYLMPSFYVPPLKLPLYWRDDVTGVLPEAVWAYINHGADKTQPAPTTEQLALIIQYLQYYIKAPAWEGAGTFAAELAQLREQATQLRTLEDIRTWLYKCMEIALDPF